MTLKTFDPNKPVQTRSGLKARIVARLAGPMKTYPLLVVITHEDGSEFHEEYTLEGGEYQYDNSTPMSLMNIPERREEFFNIMGPGWTREDAEKAVPADARKALVKIVYEDDVAVGAEVVA